MWSPKKTVAVWLLAATLCACGFQPIYTRQDSSSNAAVELQKVQVNLINDRMGQKLHNALLDRLNPRGRPAKPEYYLDVRMSTSKVNLGIQRDDTSTRAKLTIIATYSLKNREKDTLFKSVSRSVSGYNIVDSDYATQSAEFDAIDRSVRVISEDIRARLAVFLSQGGGRQS